MAEIFALRAFADTLKPKKRGARPPCARRRNEPIAPSKFAESIGFAIEDARRLIAHVDALFDGDLAKELGLSDWLRQGDDIMSLLHSAILKGSVPVPLPEGERYDWFEEIEDLDAHFFDQRWQAEDSVFDKIEDDMLCSPFAQMLTKSLDYWVEEIVERAQFVFYLVIGAEDLHRCGESVRLLRQVSFPGRRLSDR